MFTILINLDIISNKSSFISYRNTSSRLTLNYGAEPSGLRIVSPIRSAMVIMRSRSGGPSAAGNSAVPSGTGSPALVKNTSCMVPGEVTFSRRPGLSPTHLKACTLPSGIFTKSPGSTSRFFPSRSNSNWLSRTKKFSSSP